jgi:tetratricopeptide (TPR) repeat protein
MYSNRNWISKLILLITAATALPLSVSAQHVRIVSNQRSLLPPDAARDLFNEGEVLYDQRQFVDAEKRFREVVTRYPKNQIADKADYYLIRTLTQIGKNSEALSRIDTFTRQYPKSLWLNDVQEIQMRLTDQVPANAENILLRRSGPFAGRATGRAQAPPQATPVPPSPPVPGNPSNPPQPFNTGLRVYAPFGPPAFQSSDPEISFQQEIMQAMFRVNFNRALEIAAARLRDNPADPVVLSSLHVVATSRSEQAVPMLLDIAKNSTNPKARRDAIYWLGQSRGDKDAIVDTLAGLVPTMSEDDSEAVTFALSQIRSDKAANALASIARDKNKNEKIRNNAVFWIAESRAPNRVVLLEDVYKNNMDSSKVRSQVTFALSQTRDPRAATALGNIAAGDSDMEVRKQAVYWLGQMRNPEANQALERLLQRK